MKTPHETAVLDVVSCARLIGNDPNISDEALVKLLVERGLSEASAEKLRAFVPSAFAWALLQKMGVTKFPDHYIVLDRTEARHKHPVADEHYFTAALGLATDLLANGWRAEISGGVFEAVVSRSAEIGAANQILQKGLLLSDAQIGPFVVFGASSW